MSNRLNSSELIRERSAQFLTQDVLIPFFRNLMENTPAGYVIFGEKPIYLGSFCQPEHLMPGSNKHREAIFTFLSLKALPRRISTSNYILMCQGLQDSSCESNEFMLINRKAFLRVVKDNLLLFKHKFGYSVTPEVLLERLIDPKLGFSKLFGEEIALQGIVLGYGTNNSITYERASSLSEISRNPLSPPNRLLAPPRTEEEMMSRFESSAKKKGVWKELKDISYYRPKGSNDRLKIPFSFHQNSKETKTLIKKYKQAEARVSHTLKDKDFPRNIFKRLQIHHQIKNSLIEVLPLKEEIISRALARSIKDTFSGEISSEFIEGMKAADSQSIDILEQIQELIFFEVLRKQRVLRNSLRSNENKSREFLQQIASYPDACCLIPNKLYYRTLGQGNPEKFIISKHKIVEANYIIKDIDGHIIDGVYAGQLPIKFDLENLISGLAHGMIGMNEGEIREVYIHPDFAYGMYSEFGNGNPLQIQVELVNLGKATNNSIKLPYLQPVDAIFFAPEVESIEAFNVFQKRYNYLCGMQTWFHYKKAGKLVNLDTVIEEILSNPPSAFDKEREKEVIAILNWILYQNL